MYNLKDFQIEKDKLIKYIGTDKIVSVPDGITIISVGAFEKCSFIEEIILPNSVKNIYMKAFENCTNLKKVNIPDGVEQLNSWIFRYCSNLKEINIPKSVNYIDGWAFTVCGIENVIIDEENPNYCFKNGIIYSKNETSLVRYINGHKNTYKSYTIPNQVKTIKMNAFDGCRNLEEIIIPNGVVRIEDGAFSFCPHLKKAVLPNTLKFIDNIFICSNLEKIVMPNISQWSFKPTGITLKTLCKYVDKLPRYQVFEIHEIISKENNLDCINNFINILIKPRIKKDDVSIMEDINYFKFSNQEIDILLDIAIKNKAHKCVAELLDYKNNNFGFDKNNPLSEFLLD